MSLMWTRVSGLRLGSSVSQTYKCNKSHATMDFGRRAAKKLQQQVHIQQSTAAAAIAAVVMPATAHVALPGDQPAITQFLQFTAPTPQQSQHNQVVQQHMEQRRQQLEHEVQQQEQQQQQEAQRLLQQTGESAVAEFWKLVADFIILNPLPRGFHSLPHDHPFMPLAADTHFLQLAPRIVITIECTAASFVHYLSTCHGA